MAGSQQSAEDRLISITSILGNTQLNAEEKNEKISELASGLSVQKAVPGPANGEAAGHDLTTEQKMALVTSNLQESLNLEHMEDAINKEKRSPVIYWGTAPTGRPHCGYFVPMLKIASFLKAGCTVKILLADVHAFLDALKSPIELVKHRAEYYQFVVVSMLKSIGVPIDRLEFVLGSTYQLSSAYQMDLLRLCTIVSINDAKRAGAEVVKQEENGAMSGLIYPLMQALDEQYLGVDSQFGGVDQRKIFVLAKDVLPKIGYKERTHLMNPMVPGLAGGKMSASDPDSKIDILDAPEVVAKKLKKAYAVAKEVEGNGILGFIQYVLLPAGALKHGKPHFVVERRDAEPLVYDNIERMHEDYKADILTPQNVKPAVTAALNELLSPIQQAYNESKEWQEALDKAYPQPPPPEKKQKKQKNKGTKAPGKEVETQPDGSVEGKDKDEVNLASSAQEAIGELNTAKTKVQNEDAP